MKRALFETVKVLPYSSGGTIDRGGFLSARLGLLATGTGDLKITVRHCDEDGGPFELVFDTKLFLGDTRVTRDADQKITDVYATITAEAGDEVQLDIDLLGCKQCVQIVVTGSATLALALGDPAFAPVV